MAYIDVSPTVKYYDFENTEWILLNPFADGSRVTVTSVGELPIIVTFKDTDTPLTDEIVTAEHIVTTPIGGINYEVSNPVNTYMFAKSPTINADALLDRVMVRVYGTINPFDDLAALATVVTGLEVQLGNHKGDKTNPHEVTKEQVGLGNIPPDISDDPETNSSEVLATTTLTNNIHTTLTDHIDNLENPHQTTKAHVGLPLTPNYPPATEEEAIDITRNDVLLTPFTASKLVDYVAQPTSAVRPQLIIGADKGDLPIGWTSLDVNAPSKIISRESTYEIRIHKGLRVSFAEVGKSRISQVLPEDIVVSLPPQITTTKYYVYCDLDVEGNITDIAVTEDMPTEGFVKASSVGDFYNVGECTMYTYDGTPTRRVYLGHVDVFEGIINSCYSSPVGFKTYAPVLEDLVIRERYLYEVPFLGECTATAEVYYNGVWGPTYWNDQYGIKATVIRSNPNVCVVQCGAFGFLSCGMYSGSPFGASYDPIDQINQLRVRILYEKTY